MWTLAKTQRDGNMKTLIARVYLQWGNLGLTFAGLHALRPLVINVFVAGASAVLVPSATRSATTGSAGFIERATLWARHLITSGDG